MVGEEFLAQVPILGILLLQKLVCLSLGRVPNFLPKAVLPLHLLHLQHSLGGGRRKPGGINSSQDEGNKEEPNLQRGHNRLGSGLRFRCKAAQLSC